jgi:hypothetical protein
VGADGVVQTVELPTAGSFVVTFTYVPKAAVIGMVVSTVSVLALIGLFIWWAAVTRRKRPRASETVAAG